MATSSQLTRALSLQSIGTRLLATKSICRSFQSSAGDNAQKNWFLRKKTLKAASALSMASMLAWLAAKRSQKESLSGGSESQASKSLPRATTNDSPPSTQSDHGGTLEVFGVVPKEQVTVLAAREQVESVLQQYNGKASSTSVEKEQGPKPYIGERVGRVWEVHLPPSDEQLRKQILSQPGISGISSLDTFVDPLSVTVLDSSGQQSTLLEAETTAINKPTVWCFILGSGIDASHSEFEPGQVLELINDGVKKDSNEDPNLEIRKSQFHLSSIKDRKERDAKFHETSVAILIAGKTTGQVPGAHVIDVRVPMHYSNGQWRFRTRDVQKRLRDIECFLRTKPHMLAVVNMSLGISPVDNFEDGECKTGKDWKYPTYYINKAGPDEYIKRIHRSGALVVVAAGNSCAPASSSWPASNPYTLTVGALKGNKECDFSNFGSAVGLYAVGDGGTSFAAPLITAQAIKLLVDGEFQDPGQQFRAEALKHKLLYDARVDQIENKQFVELSKAHPADYYAIKGITGAGKHAKEE